MGVFAAPIGFDYPTGKTTAAAKVLVFKQLRSGYVGFGQCLPVIDHDYVVLYFGFALVFDHLFDVTYYVLFAFEGADNYGDIYIFALFFRAESRAVNGDVAFRFD